MTWKDKLFGWLKSSGKKKEPEAEPKQKVTAEYKNGVSIFIDFILKEDKENNLILGKRKERYYICFKNEYFAPFFSDWFVLLKGFVQGELSQSTYDDSFEALCSKYKKAAEKEAKTETIEQNNKTPDVIQENAKKSEAEKKPKAEKEVQTETDTVSSDMEK